jgi:hypothetical protein
MTYEQWKAEVSDIVEEICGLPTDLLPDWLSRDTYDDGVSPKIGAQICLETAGFYEHERLVEVD